MPIPGSRPAELSKASRIEARLAVTFPWWARTGLAIAGFLIGLALTLHIWRPTEAEADLVMDRLASWFSDSAVIHCR